MMGRALAPMLAALTCVAATRLLTAQESTLTNSIGMEFVLIRPGSMLVGRFQPECPRPNPAAAQDSAAHPGVRWSPDDYARCEEMVRRDARPGFVVTISRAYYIGKYEVTQAEWTRVMGRNSSVFHKGRLGADADRHPVDNVSWADAQSFLGRLNALDTTAHYRLPTEFEWEYAARAGATREPSWDEIRQSAWEQDVDLGTTHPVGGKKPNAWGLYDTLGNVWEWVADFYNDQVFATVIPPTSGTTHVLKGGSFVSDVKNTTWSTHAGGPGSGFDVGFRVVRELR